MDLNEVTMDSYTNYYDSSKMFQTSCSIVMGTRLDLLLLGLKKSKAENIWSELEKEVNRLDRMLNKFDPDSELARLNRAARLSPTAVNQELWAILCGCKLYHRQTLGYFDISLNDLNRVRFNPSNQTLFFECEDLELDLSGYAKGYALEKIREILMANRVNQAFINFGNSSILTLGKHPHGVNWSIGVSDPYTHQTVGTLELMDNRAMSTSGNTPGHEGHLINPLTGIRIEDRKMVSVSAPNAITAEVLSTALMVAEERTFNDILKNFIDANYQIFMV